MPKIPKLVTASFVLAVSAWVIWLVGETGSLRLGPFGRGTNDGDSGNPISLVVDAGANKPPPLSIKKGGGLSLGESSENQQLIERITPAISRVRDAFQASERKRSDQVNEMTSEHLTAVSLVIHAPSESEIAEMGRVASLELSSFAKGSAEYKKSYERVSEMLRTYIDYPDKIKLVTFSIPSDPSSKKKWLGKDAFFTESFLPGLEEVAEIQKTGSIPDRFIKRTDDEWNSASSWAKSRYGYLFNVESQPDAKAAGN